MSDILFEIINLGKKRNLDSEILHKWLRGGVHNLVSYHTNAISASLPLFPEPIIDLMATLCVLQLFARLSTP
jgi:hypothetical protein